MKISKITVGLLCIIPITCFAEYRIHIPMTDGLSNAAIKFTNKPDNNNGNGGTENGSNENDLQLTDEEGANKCAYNNDNYLLIEVTAAFKYTYEWKSTYFSIPFKRANAEDSGFATTLEYNNKFYDLSGSEVKIETVGEGANKVEKNYYKICEYTEMSG